MSRLRSALRSQIREIGHIAIPSWVKVRLARRLNRHRTHERWSIGVHAGSTRLPANPSELMSNFTADQVDDASAAFVADPFAINVAGVWHLFFEILNRESGKGEIALATSENLKTWVYQGIVLSEPHHLSYPQVVEIDGEYLMIPETSEIGAVLLYRATSWPSVWVRDTVLLEGRTLLDPSLFFHEGRWWIFVEVDPRHRYDTLRLFGAPNIRGPWTEHPCSPIVSGNPSIARPAGRIVGIDGEPHRLAQDCSESYGAGVHAFRITQLDGMSYAEEPAPELSLAGDGTLSTHHLDSHDLGGSWVTFMDLRP